VIVIGPHVLELQVARNTFIRVNTAELKAHLSRPQEINADVRRVTEGAKAHE